MSEYQTFGEDGLTDAPADPGHESVNDGDELSPEELDRVSGEMIALFDNVYNPKLLDPLLYIENSIDKMINRSSASDELKNRVDAKTQITISYRHRPDASSGLIDAGQFLEREERTFTLDEIVCDTYRRVLHDYQQVQIEWPSEFPQDLIDTLEAANLQARYQVDVEQHLKTPDARFLLALQAKTEVQNRLDRYAERAETPAAFRQLVEAYTRGEAALELVQFRSRTRQYDVAQVLYLGMNSDASSDGLLIFLGATDDDAIVPLPGKGRRWFIESSPRLRRLILQRLPLHYQLAHGDQKLRYVYSFFGPMVKTISPLQFHPSKDVFEALYAFRIKNMLWDIDTLVSTDTERLVDRLLEIGVSLLQGLSVVVTLPIGGAVGLAPRLLVSFLLGEGAAALEAARGENADVPEEAQAHYNAALYSAIAELVGPLLQQLLGKAVSALKKARISVRVFKHMSRTRPYAGKPGIGYDKIRPSPAEVKQIKTQLVQQLSEGPEHAQKLVDKTGRLINKTVEGHDLVVYRGKVFRGDMRPPQDIFEKGFELRTPAAEIQKDIHQVTGVRGGFGGGHDALDIDGRGISTSVFYYKDNVGAFVYGGQKGGYTYVINARKFDGYHLYQNHHNAMYPNAKQKIQFKPTEINYAHDIPASAVLGAYDASGNFIANNLALRVYARELAIKEIRRLAQIAMAAGIKIPLPVQSDH